MVRVFYGLGGMQRASTLTLTLGGMQRASTLTLTLQAKKNAARLEGQADLGRRRLQEVE